LKEIVLSSPLILKRESAPFSDPYCIQGYHISSSSIFYISLLDIYPMGVYHDVEKERRKI